MLKYLYLILLLSLFGCSIPNLSKDSKPFGYFKGDVKTEWINNGKDMKLLEDVSYFEPYKKEYKQWDAPKDFIIDGATIPKLFWSIIGSPFTGFYRNASVFHDYGCYKRLDTWQNTHFMFYKAMRCNGVSIIQAKTMLCAVWYYGPHWKKPSIIQVILPKKEIIIPEQPTTEHLNDLKDWIEDYNPPLEKIIPITPEGQVIEQK